MESSYYQAGYQAGARDMKKRLQFDMVALTVLAVATGFAVGLVFGRHVL